MKNIISRIVRRLADKGSAYAVMPPFNYAQNVVEHHLHDYLSVSSSDIKDICIVGGYKGLEIPRLLRKYKNVNITVFEPSNRYKEIIEKRFENEDRVVVIQSAVSNEVGKATFYETSIKGSGSLLEVGSLAESSYGMKGEESFEVEVTTLDSVQGITRLDCLWIDVQGAEMLVLEGGENLLQNTNAVFIEVSVHPDLYDGGALKSELESILSRYGFQSAIVGLDKGNLTGNAFYIKVE